MNISQIRLVCAIVDRGLSMSRAAEALGMPQPVVSRQIQALERALGVTIFVRNQKRILALSEPGAAIERIARRLLDEAQNIRAVAAEHVAPNEGELHLATTHTYARHVLPLVIKKYNRRFRDVRVSLLEGSPNEIGDWLSAGSADLSISTKPISPHANLGYLPVEALERVVLTRKGHPLLELRKVGLDDLAGYPIVTFHPSFPGGDSIHKTFSANGLNPRIVVRATNADVIRACVREGLGVGIASRLGMNASENRGLRTIDVGHLFPPNQIYIGLRKRHYLRPYVHEFLRLLVPDMTNADVERIAKGEA